MAGWKSLPAWQPLPASHLPLNPPMEPAVAQKLENKLLASKKKGANWKFEQTMLKNINQPRKILRAEFQAELKATEFSLTKKD